MKNIFITGESGTIPIQLQILSNSFGFNVVNTQLEDNFLTGFKTHQSFKVRKLELDFLKRNFLLNFHDLWEKVDLIIHSGAYVGTDFCNSDPTNAIRTNVEGTQNIVDICNKFKIPLIYLSTTAILDPKFYSDTCHMTEMTSINPQTIYGITKYAGELIVKNTCITKNLVLRPVFGFGNYPEDLHSALTKTIYVLYRNLKGKDTKLTILLDNLIPKSYTRVENIATCILNFADILIKDYKKLKSNLFNIGENHEKSKDWSQLIDIIGSCFEIRNLCTKSECNDIFNKKITFAPQKDYLHFHNIDDSLLQLQKIDFINQKNYISIKQGIALSLNSVIQNLDKEPYWL